jgi:hypothetical protein
VPPLTIWKERRRQRPRVAEDIYAGPGPTRPSVPCVSIDRRTERERKAESLDVGCCRLDFGARRFIGRRRRKIYRTTHSSILLYSPMSLYYSDDWRRVLSRSRRRPSVQLFYSHLFSYIYKCIFISLIFFFFFFFYFFRFKAIYFNLLLLVPLFKTLFFFCYVFVFFGHAKRELLAENREKVPDKR